VKNRGQWSPNRVYQATDRDDRYNRYISNFDSPFYEWNLRPLREAFSESMGIPSKEIKKVLGDEFEKLLTDFVLSNPDRIVRTARVAPKDINAEARVALAASIETQNRVFRSMRSDRGDYYFLNGEQLVFYSSKTRQIDGEWVTALPASTIWDDLLSNNIHKEGEVEFPNGKKPEALLKRVLAHTTRPGDFVLDSFLGSGTTAAVAHKMGRRFIGIEMGEQAVTHCVPRLRKVIDGEQSGISKAENWKGGGGFRFYRLGSPIFDEHGHIHSSIRFDHLAAHIWFSETHTPLSHKRKRSPLLGNHNETAYYLLYNGILGDKRPDGGNVLTRKILSELPAHDGPKVIYGESSRLSAATLKQLNIVFKQTPYDVKAR